MHLLARFARRLSPVPQGAGFLRSGVAVTRNDLRALLAKVEAEAQENDRARDEGRILIVQPPQFTVTTQPPVSR